MRIARCFQQLKAQKKKALIPFITAGDPDLGRTRDLIVELAREGADLIELGVPFSDPLADGPTIQRATTRSLARGTNLQEVLQLVQEIRSYPLLAETPILLLVYINTLLAYGLERLGDSLSQAGVDGLIIPDLPYEEAAPMRAMAKNHPWDLIPLISPTSGDRIPQILAEASGFVYCVSVRGVTGTRTELPHDLPQTLQAIRQATSLPVAIGFGISTPQQVTDLAPLADAIIVGSALVEVIEEHLGEEDLIPQVGRFIGQLAAALKTTP